MKPLALFLVCLLALSVLVLAAEIEMTSVKSSLLDKVGYDPETKTLVIQMNNSLDVYSYANVPQAVYNGLLEADSKGAYYVKKIKGRYDVTRK